MHAVPTRAMVAAAHPDDAEFGCGGTVAKWISQGCRVFYVIGTNGDKGDDQGKYTCEQLAAIRKQEQQQAADLLGVEEVLILPHADGTLAYTPELRGELVRCIRRWKPEALFTHDPTVVFQSFGGINHNDHRTLAMAAIDAAYPYARGKLNYPEQIAEGLEPHKVQRVYVWGSNEPNHVEDVSEFAERKLQALLKHQSQYRDPEGMRTWTLEFMEAQGRPCGYKYGEAFRVAELA